MQKISLALLTCFILSYSYGQKQTGSSDILKLVATEYNKRISLWGNAGDMININNILFSSSQKIDSVPTMREVYKSLGILEPPLKINNPATAIQTAKPLSERTVVLSEVVLNGYIKQTSEVPMGNFTVLKAKDFRDMPTTNIADLLQGKVAGAEVIKASGDPNASSQISIHGISSLNQNNPLYVIDGVIQPFAGAGSNINPNDIASITVLKDAGSCAIYGAAAAGGVILITTKSGKESAGYNSLVTLRSMEDVDYIESIRNTEKENLYLKYLSLEPQFRHNMNFYLDMALYFYEKNATEYIDEMLGKAAIISADYGNDYQSQLALAYVDEYTKHFNKAIDIYTRLYQSYGQDLHIIRNLAWTYFENNNYDTAVNILYNGIISAGENATDRQTIRMKDIMLADMNMIIALYKDKINDNYIPKEIIKPVPVDMRVLLEINNNGFANLTVAPSRKHSINFDRPIGSNHERLQTASDDYSFSEFIVKDAPDKKYSFSVPYNDNQKGEKKPILIRIIKIKDFSKSTQGIDVDIVNLGNQSGTILFDEFKISK